MVVRFYARIASEGNKLSFVIPKSLIESVSEARDIVEKGKGIASIYGVSFIFKVRKVRLRLRSGEVVVHRVTVPASIVKRFGLSKGQKVFVEMTPL